MELIRQLPLRPIRSRLQYAEAAKVLDALVMREDLDADEQDYLEVLENLIEAYDDRHAGPAFGDVSPAQILKSLIEQAPMTARDVAKLLGVTEALVSMILAGKRNITVAQARILAERFKVGFACFL